MRKKQLANFVRVEEGQNIVEFALLLPVLMWILMGIIQFGFIFAIYITLNNSAREASRRGYYLDVQTFYHLQVFIPLIQQFLPDDPVKGAPWIRIPARITVVVN